MPDLGTHVTVAWIAGRAAGWKGGGSWRTLAPFILGSALPDILARAPHLTLRSPQVATLIQGLHTPACLILACLALSFLWQEKGRGRMPNGPVNYSARIAVGWNWMRSGNSLKRMYWRYEPR